MEDNNILSELKELQSYKELGSIKVLFIFVAIYENWYIFIRDPVDVGGAFENCFDLSEVGCCGEVKVIPRGICRRLQQGSSCGELSKVSRDNLQWFFGGKAGEGFHILQSLSGG